jgi:DNA topoisomerase IB
MRCFATATGDATAATGDAGWRETEASLALEGHADVVNAVAAVFGNTVNDSHTSSLRPHTLGA